MQVSFKTPLPKVLLIDCPIETKKKREICICISAVPSPPTAPLEIRTIGPNAVVIEWGIPESDGGAPLEGYNIAIRDIKKTMWMEVGRVSKGVQKYTLRDLQEDHEYLIRIFARNEVGLSDPLESDEPFKVLPSAGNYLLICIFSKIIAKHLSIQIMSNFFFNHNFFIFSYKGEVEEI